MFICISISSVRARPPPKCKTGQQYRCAHARAHGKALKSSTRHIIPTPDLLLPEIGQEMLMMVALNG